MKEYPYQNTYLKSLKGEQWKDIPGFELYFMVSNFGRIKRLEYELEYSDGRIFVKPERIIKPTLVKIPNEYVKDELYFIRNTITLFKQKYNYSVARLVYHCFVEPFNIADDSVVILTKDGDGRNIKPANLNLTSLSEKQARPFQLNRREPLVVNDEARLRSIAKARLRNNKQVSQYTMKGIKLKTYKSIAIASQKTGISHSHISNRARGSEFSAGGFIWRLGNAPTVDINPMLDTIKKWRNRNKEKFGTKISQYSMKGRRMAVYPTINDAAQATGISNSDISLVVRNKRLSAGGFYWQKGYGPSKIDLSEYKYGIALRAKKKQRPVRQFSKTGKPLQRFESIKEAAENVGVNSTTVIGALRGKHETAGGFKWKYL